MNASQRVVKAAELMHEFAGLTGLLPGSNGQGRYLWTDAFAVCNFLSLYQQTNDENYKDLALSLVKQVHNVLGHHRDDDQRKGWISSLDQTEAELHPTIGGLRIGKLLNERSVSDPIDNRLEWDRDGQYYHYLTKWMHTLNCVSSVTGASVFRRWAVELAKTAYAKFTYDAPHKQKRMFWKMSIDLSYPLVTSMGHHDPLDGLITCSELQARFDKDSNGLLDLTEEIQGLAEICRQREWATDDLLGIGGLLSDALRAAQLVKQGCFPQEGLLSDILEACRIGLDACSRNNSLNAPASYRLAFRELGLSIGLHALERMEKFILPGVGQPTVHEQVEDLLKYRTVADKIEAFWLQPANRKERLFLEHREINIVMLATSLCPDGFLTL